MPEPDGKFYHTWEQAISILRSDPLHQTLVYDAYLTADLTGNCRRFAESREFAEVIRLIEVYRPGSRDVLDVPAGNGIATFAFAKLGLNVVGVEPDPSSSVGRGAIATVLNSEGLKARIVDAFGEKLPFEENSFDVVYVRQGLHHAQDLKAMLSEYARVLRPGGLLLACREHVVDDYGPSLQAFLDSQVDHQLYGGENAFTLADYREALSSAGLTILAQFGPYDSMINLHPNTEESLLDKVRDSRPGRLLGLILPRSVVNRIGMWYLRRSNRPGRLYSFVAVAP
ncbi:class I SAM-dependent methyltransferase [Bradyrhizobium sp. GCM10023182]|uniref:Methyltransferase domain-containing protein n=1 Tax=Bradyrhizobium zhengyangense TaxID=2911009 RepID=A0ABS9LX37_9BRAD|nr:class I SAM-dependent methyltransferase [Bradyrhizobium zhengyangense]MCG2671593.1 methyltransferase domain-containing protein [Bradyrhizobium zhengyangense]